MQVLPIKCWSGILKPAEMILAINVPATKIIAPCIKVCFLFFCKNSTPFFGIPARLLVYIVFCRASPAEKLPQGKLAAGQQFHTDMGIAPHVIGEIQKQVPIKQPALFLLMQRHALLCVPFIPAKYRKPNRTGHRGCIVCCRPGK